MSKSIKVSEVVYNRLRDIQQPRESLSEIVARLLKMYELLQLAQTIIKGSQTELQRQFVRGLEESTHQ